MNKVAIGKRSILPTIRDIWPKEPEFSDWLAKEEGVELLTQDLGVEIENTRRELKGANFPCDIVANRSKVCDWFSAWTPKVFLAFQDRVRTLASSGEQ